VPSVEQTTVLGNTRWQEGQKREASSSDCSVTASFDLFGVGEAAAQVGSGDDHRVRELLVMWHCGLRLPLVT
jgi:hypothetical protein